MPRTATRERGQLCALAERSRSIPTSTTLPNGSNSNAVKTYHDGSIRDLNAIGNRAVILSETDTFVVDYSWLRRESAESLLHKSRSALPDREVEMIEAALAETPGRITGPSRAAARLGMPRQTLESKIRRLGIDKYEHKTVHLPRSAFHTQA
jgi:transcriptional regulator of acetoin/glycerol metabolism